MAIQLFAYAKSKGYDIKIYADTAAVSYLPFEFTAADWKVTYDTQDIYRPGIVASRMELVAPITQYTSSAGLEGILQDANGIFYLTLSKNYGDLWKGYCTPSAGSIEVINGQRFITIIAGDGFQLLNIPSDGYTYTGVKPFSTQIADIFNRVGLFSLFNGFLVSKDLTRVFGSSGDYDSLYLNGCKHAGVYNTGTTFHSFREVIEGICTAFGLRMYQDKGYMVFQDFTRPESSFNAYNTLGQFLLNIDYSESKTLDVVAGGTKMYQPPLRITNTQFLISGEPYENINDQFRRTIHTVWLTPFTYQTYNWVDLGTFFCDGISHIDYNMDIRVRYTIPPLFSDNVTWEARLYFYLGEYTTQGTSWKKLDDYVSHTANENVTGDPISSTPGSFTMSFNNNHLPTVPSIGEVSLGLYVEASQIAGTSLGGNQPAEAKWEITQHGSTSPYRNYRADNSRRKLGEDVTYSTRFGDLNNTSFPKDQQIVYMGTSQTASTWPSTWLEPLPDGSTNSNGLLQITTNRIAQRRALPVEYYELDLHQTSAVTHTGQWGGVDYFPVNIEYNYEGSRVTYAKIINYPVQADPERYAAE